MRQRRQRETFHRVSDSELRAAIRRANQVAEPATESIVDPKTEPAQQMKEERIWREMET